MKVQQGVAQNCAKIGMYNWEDDFKGNIRAY